MPCTRSRLSFISATAMLGLCLVLAGAEVRAEDEVVFMASVDKNEVGLNETIVLIISIKAPKNVSDRILKNPEELLKKPQTPEKKSEAETPKTKQ